MRLKVWRILSKHRPDAQRGDALVAALGGAVQDIDPNRVDPESGRVQPVQRNVCRRVAQFAPALVSAKHFALDPVQVPQHGGSVFRLSVAQGLPNPGRRDLVSVFGNQFGNRAAESHFTAVYLQSLRAAGATLPEAEVGPHGDVDEAKAVADDVPGEGLRGQGGKAVVERHLVEELDAKALQAVRPGGSVHEPEGRGGRREIFSGMRLESKYAKRRVCSLCRNAKDRLMTDVDTIEIANRGSGSPILRLHIRGVANDAHASGRILPFALLQGLPASH